MNVPHRRFHRLTAFPKVEKSSGRREWNQFLLLIYILFILFRLVNKQYLDIVIFLLEKLKRHPLEIEFNQFQKLITLHHYFLLHLIYLYFLRRHSIL